MAKKLDIGSLLAFQLAPWRMGAPKPILNAHNTQTIRTEAKPANVINMVLTTHFFWTKPPKRTARPGTLIRATKVAAVSCQALSPVFSHAWSEQLTAP